MVNLVNFTICSSAGDSHLTTGMAKLHTGRFGKHQNSSVETSLVSAGGQRSKPADCLETVERWSDNSNNQKGVVCCCCCFFFHQRCRHIVQLLNHWTLLVQALKGWWPPMFQPQKNFSNSDKTVLRSLFLLGRSHLPHLALVAPQFLRSLVWDWGWGAEAQQGAHLILPNPQTNFPWIVESGSAASSPDEPLLLNFFSQTALPSQWHGQPPTISCPLLLLLFWALRLCRLWSPFSVLSQTTELEISGILAGALKRYRGTLLFLISFLSGTGEVSFILKSYLNLIKFF